MARPGTSGPGARAERGGRRCAGGNVAHDELWTQHRTVVFGLKRTAARIPRPCFPLLIKVLDCCDDLSLQVHPPASIAPELKGEPKTEMWYVAHADPGASLYAGVRAGVDRSALEQALKEGTAAQCVPVPPAQTGDSLFVPSGRLHALGGGLLIYEIQQNSDTTYRVFDWNRVGLDGKPRELHVEQSLKCIDFTDVDPVLDRGQSVLAECEHFRVSRVKTGHAVPADRFRLIMPITNVQWAGEISAAGDLALWPA